MEVLEAQLQDGYTPEIEEDFFLSKLELEAWEKREEIRISQQAKKKWLEVIIIQSSFMHL